MVGLIVKNLLEIWFFGSRRYSTSGGAMTRRQAFYIASMAAAHFFATAAKKRGVLGVLAVQPIANCRNH
jgi:hypothetical protein